MSQSYPQSSVPCEAPSVGDRGVPDPDAHAADAMNSDDSMDRAPPPAARRAEHVNDHAGSHNWGPDQQGKPEACAPEEVAQGDAHVSRGRARPLSPIVEQANRSRNPSTDRTRSTSPVSVSNAPRKAPPERARSRSPSPRPFGEPYGPDASQPAWLAANRRSPSVDMHRLATRSVASRSISPDRFSIVSADARALLFSKARAIRQKHDEERRALRLQIEKLKAAGRSEIPSPDVAAPAGTGVPYDDMLPAAYAENSRLVRRLLDEQLDNTARMEALWTKVAIVLQQGTYPEEFIADIGNKVQAEEARSLRAQLAASQERARQLVDENAHLGRRIAECEKRNAQAHEESRVLLTSLRHALEQETFERKRMNALYDEERNVLNASLRETIQQLAADNQRYRLRLVEANLPDD
ncbi:Uncharacterized protein PBTT_08166 [Plasmodiophora brassicae]|nr:hypothetical protein PBRA_004231 [Plasmodiophora brassicae]